MSEQQHLTPRLPDAEQQRRLLRSVRRSVLWFAGAAVLALLSIPAIFDLRALLIALGAICAALGVLTAAFTWFDES